ncbi:MAG: response regulator [Candidatus Sumerlaeaceae bacterium]|nr:response regulator [Candidatus Sumerlaeaceae bacterium]
MTRRPLILVADDVREIRDLLRYTLQRHYDVIVARNGEEAWELFNAYEPDLVISDVVMPRINGLDLVKKIKLQSYKPTTPVLLVTAITKDRELPDAFWKDFAGSDGYITKPFTAHEVLAAVQRLLHEAKDELAAGMRAHEEVRTDEL